MLPIDAATLRAIAYQESGSRAQHQAFIIEEVGGVLANTLDKYEINVPLRIAHFLAQVAHESDSFCTTEEYASGATYEGSQSLGNTEPGDGRRFKGRGLIQLTGRANYTSAGERLGLDLLSNPDLAAVPATSLLIACDFWRQNKINPPADEDNIIAVTRIVNGRLLNGLDSRRAYLARAKEVLAQIQAGQIPTRVDAPATLHRGMSGNDVVRLQQALAKNDVPVAIDGVFGPGTETAVLQFQSSNGLDADGIVGPATWAKLV